jgi:hypothetical protein
MVCDVPLCLFGKVKIKTVKEECVILHNLFFESLSFVISKGKSNTFFIYNKHLVSFLLKKM